GRYRLVVPCLFIVLKLLHFWGGFFFNLGGQPMAVELAKAYVTLAVATSNIYRQEGRMFRGVEDQAGDNGRHMGRQMATSFDKAKPNVEVLEQDVKRAQDRVVAHKESGSRKMEAANRKVEIAQAKLNEVTKKYGPDSSQALRAQDQLITAQQKA